MAIRSQTNPDKQSPQTTLVARVMAALMMGQMHTAQMEYSQGGRESLITVTVRVPDRTLVDGALDSLEAEFMQELQDEPTKPLKRPTGGLQINVGGMNNLQVQWDKSAGCYRFTSVCVVCGRSFERVLRGFVTKDLIITAHDLGYTIGEHAERHRSFGDHLRELREQGEEKEDDTHKPV
jgi:hypothetical protein